jgi:hypothetical protein
VVGLAGAQPALADGAAGTTTVSFSANPVSICEPDAAPDVTISTLTTSAGHPEEVDNGKVTIQMATDGLGNPVPCGPGVTWVALNAPGQSPVAGVTSLAVDLDGLGVSAGDTVGFRAHYVTGGGSHRVDTHFAACADLGTADCCRAVEAGDACSKSQGYYGNNGSSVTGVFPLVVGVGNTLTFADGDEVEGYLPAGGEPGQLTFSYAPPTTPPGTESGNFGGQVTTLKLNVLLDPCLGQLVFEDNSSAFDGMTVAAILAHFEVVLGGGATLGGTTLGGPGNNSYNNVATELNESFDSLDCEPSDWAVSYLVFCGCTPE